MKRQRAGLSQSEGRSKKGKGFYVCDRKLLPRVKQVFDIPTKGRPPSLDDIVDQLQEKYSEYGRKKRSTFRASVLKVYQILKNDDDEEQKLQELEERFLGKRNNLSEFIPLDEDSNLVLSSDSERTDNDLQSSNLVNVSMHEMYKTSNSKRNSEDEIRHVPSGKDILVDSNSTSQHITDIISVELPIKNTTPGNTPEVSTTKASQDDAQNVNRKNDLVFNDKNTILQRKTPRKTPEIRKRRTQDVTPNEIDKEPTVPTLRFSNIGGCHACIQEVCKLLVHIKHPEVFKTLGITPPRGFLLHGPPGCGKTLLAHAIAGELLVPLVNVASTELVSGVSGESESKIRDLFTRAITHAPCVLFLDEVDAITPKRETASKEMERRIVAQLLSCLDELNMNKEAQVVVIGATNRPDALDPALRRAGRFDREIRMGIPDEQAREQILKVQCKDLKLSGEFDYASLAAQTPGYVGADLMALAREAAMCAVTRIFKDIEENKLNSTSTEVSNFEKEKLDIVSWLRSKENSFTDEQLQKLSIEMNDFNEALGTVQPSAKREGFATIPDVTWNDIGALQDIREELTMAIIAPVRHRQAFAELGLVNPPGILLAGPPGCGKTLLAKAIANESGINFISVKGPELLNMYVGESERAVRQVFQRAQNSAPCVIFFDELDALCPRRSDSAESNSSARVVNQLLTEMDGLETRRQVFIMAATNRPDIIDPAILRPGRLDKVLYVGLPQQQDRIAILSTVTKAGTKPLLSSDVNLEDIAGDQRCQGFSGADLAALVREASVNALKEHMAKNDVTLDPGCGHTTSDSMVTTPGQTNNNNTVTVSMKHFDLAFKKIKPSVSKQEQLVYKLMQQKMSNMSCES